MNNAEDRLSVLRDIIVAYVSKNHVPASEIGVLICDVHMALTERIQLQSTDKNNISLSNDDIKFASIPIESSIKPDGIVSLIDGRTYKTLKRHLKAHGLTPESYRRKFGLPENYPMVAPSYAARRAAIARRTGLGRPGFMAGSVSEPHHEASQSIHETAKDKK